MPHGSTNREHMLSHARAHSIAGHVISAAAYVHVTLSVLGINTAQGGGVGGAQPPYAAAA